MKNKIKEWRMEVDAKKKIKAKPYNEKKRSRKR